MTFVYHEQIHRGRATLQRLEQARITVCGAGALGANVAESLARAGAQNLTVIDRDRIEERNLSTQPWHASDVGSLKAKILAADLYRAVGANVRPQSVELTAGNVRKLLAGSHLVVDAFDNSVARGVVTDWCAHRGLPCVHAGIAEGYAEIIWNEAYRVPSARADDVCDYPLARNLVTLTVAILAETVLRYLAEGRRNSWTITFEDLMVQPFPPASGR